MLHTILPLLEGGISTRTWRDYLGESGEDHNDKLELKGSGTQGRIVHRQENTSSKPPMWLGLGEGPESSDDGSDDSRLEGSGLKGLTALRQGTCSNPQWPDRWSFQMADRLYPENTWATISYYHLSLWIPGASFPWNLFVEDETVRIYTIFLNLITLNNLTKWFSIFLV